MDADDRQAAEPAPGGVGPEGDQGDAAELFDFLDAYFEDLDSGREYDLAHYLERFPGREESVRREFLAQQARRGAAWEGPAPVLLEGSEAEESRVGPYRLLSEIGRGGQGVVYLAEDSRIARRVALKVLPPAALFLSEDARRRLQREAEVISRLDHPGICGIFDAEIGQELAYIAMPFVEGRTLSSLIAAERDGAQGERELTVPVGPRGEEQLRRLLALFEEAGHALHSAHEAGVVHRDIKPANLMVTPEGKPVWLDFGQARDAQSQLTDLTLSGEIFGTPAYMAPEQVAGRSLDRRTDVWALGVSLFEALTLRRPFEAPSAHALLLAVQNDELPDPRELNPALGEELAVVLETALERDVTRRYASAEALADDLGHILRHEPIRARPAGRLLRLRRWVQRHPVLAAMIVTISLSLAVTSHLLVEQVRLLAEQREITARKDENLSWAVGRHLARRAEALIDENPATALILAVEAVERAPNYLTRGALLDSLEATQLRMVYDANDTADGQNRISAVTIAMGGERVAVLRYDGEVRLFELESGARRGGWSAHPPAEDPRQPAAVAIAGGRGLVASASVDGRVVVHELESGRQVSSFKSVATPVERMLFGVDDETLAVRGAAGAVDLYRAADGTRIEHLAIEPVGNLRLDPVDGAFVEERDWNGTLDPPKRWDSRTGQPSRARSGVRPPPLYRLRDQSYDCLCASMDERFLFVVEERMGVSSPKILDLEGRDEVRLSLPDEVLPSAACFSPDGRRLAVIDSDGALRVWDAESGSLIVEGRGYVHPQSLAWTEDGRFVLTSRHSYYLARLWYGTERPDVYRLRAEDGPLRKAEFSPDGELALTHSESGSVILWETPSGPDEASRVGARLATLAKPGSLVSGAVFDPRGGRLLSWTDGFPAWVPLEDPGRAERLASWGDIVAAEVGPRAQRILLGRAVPLEDSLEWGLQLLVVDEHGDLLQSLNEEHDPLAGGRLAPDASSVVARDRAGGLRCWDAVTGQERWRLARADAHEEIPEDRAAPGIVDLAFDPRAEVVAVACDDLRVRFLSVSKGEVARKNMMVFPPESVEWASDGRSLLVTGSRGRGAVRVEVMDPGDPAERVLRAEFFHADDLTGGTFSPDGQLALTTSVDGTIMVRDVSGKEDARSMILLAHLRGDGGAVLDADFSSGGRPLRVVAGFADGSARVWPVDPMPAARARQPRRELHEWELHREMRLALPLEYP